MIDPEYPKYHRLTEEDSTIPTGNPPVDSGNYPSGWYHTWVSGEANYQSFFVGEDASGNARYPFQKGIVGKDILDDPPVNKTIYNPFVTEVKYNNTMDFYLTSGNRYVGTDLEGLIHVLPILNSGADVSTIRDSFLAPSGFKWTDGVK